MTLGETARKVLVDDSGRQSQSMTANDVQVCTEYVLVIPGFYQFSAIPFSCLCYSYADSPPLSDDATSCISYRRGWPDIRVSD